MTRTRVLPEARKMRCAEAGGGWQERRLTREEAPRGPGGVSAPACPRESGGSDAARRRGWPGG